MDRRGAALLLKRMDERRNAAHQGAQLRQAPEVLRTAQRRPPQEPLRGRLPRGSGGSSGSSHHGMLLLAVSPTLPPGVRGVQAQDGCAQRLCGSPRGRTMLERAAVTLSVHLGAWVLLQALDLAPLRARAAALLVTWHSRCIAVDVDAGPHGQPLFQAAGKAANPYARPLVRTVLAVFFCVVEKCGAEHDVQGIALSLRQGSWKTLLACFLHFDKGFTAGVSSGRWP